MVIKVTKTNINQHDYATYKCHVHWMLWSFFF